MAQYGNKGSKNPPWARSGNKKSGFNRNNSGMGMSQNQLPQSLLNPNLAAALPNAAMLSYPQQQMFQGQIGYQQQQIYNNLGTVQYPTRALNSAAFQTASSPSVQNNQRSNESNKERVITGNVTKLQDNFGFVDDDIFFQLSCVTNGANNLRIGSRVLVEATFNPTMPFKWNAQRIQVLPTNSNQQRGDNSGDRFSNNRYGNRNQQQQNKNKQQQQMQARRGGQVDRLRDRSASVDSDRKRRKNNDRRTSTSRDRRTRSRSRSLIKKKRRTYVPRYNVSIPKYNLNNYENDVVDLKRKFNNLYIPSDFFITRSSWQESFPIDKPFNLDVPCKFHVFSKDVIPFEKPAPEPTDADYLYSAKVILLASPGLDELYKKCVTLADDSRSQSCSPEEDMTVPSKLISLLVGQRGKEPMAIGGPWSPSLDGENPESDPGVLIKTAIRTTKYQTGIDLSNCTHWFRFLEMNYRRSESGAKGKAVGARVETVVMFVPDVWSCVPTRPEWQDIEQAYSKMLLRHLSSSASDDPEEKKEEDEEGNDSEAAEVVKKDPTHYSELDPKIMKVSDLRDELEARGLSPKGLKAQLIARLSKAIKAEADAEDLKEDDKEKVSDDELDYDDKPEEEEPKEEPKPKVEKVEIDEKEKARLEKLYSLPESPAVLVHPNTDFKAGKFNCVVASLHSLLNYRVEDNKEHSFELFLFAEMFNAMIMRDFSIHIYRSLWIASEKIIEQKEKEEKEKKKLKEAKEAKEAKEKEEKEKKADKKSDEEEKKEEEEDKEDKESVQSKDRKDEKKKEPVKLRTADPYLLLSFAYFDNTLCGYIVDRDLEDLLTNLCLSLSRAQVKKLVQRVVTKDTLHYRKLTDKSKEEIEESPLELLDFQTLFTHANRELEPRASVSAPKSQQAEKLDSGFVMFNGSLIDVAKLMNQLERNEASRLNTEKLYNRLVEDSNSLRNNYDNSVKTVKELSSDLSSYKKRLSTTNNDLDVMSARVMRYVDAIFQVKKHIDPIIKENTPEEEPKVVPKEEKKSEQNEKKRELKKEPEKKPVDNKEKETVKSEPIKKEEKPQEAENNDEIEEIKESDEENENEKDPEMECEEAVVVSNGENESDKTEDDESKDEGQEKDKPELKLKAPLKGETRAKRTPMKRDVKKDAVATPLTPSKRKRI